MRNEVSCQRQIRCGGKSPSGWGEKIIMWSLGFMVMAYGAYASVSRIAGLGVNNWMLEDDANIWLNPSQVNNYPDEVWGELGRARELGILPTEGIAIADEWGGASAEIGLFPGVVSLFVARPYTGRLRNCGIEGPWSTVAGIPPGADDLTKIPSAFGTKVTNAPASVNLQALTPENKIDLFYALGLGGAKLGLWLNQAKDSDKDDYAFESKPTKNPDDGTMVNERKSGELNFTAGGILENLGPVDKVELAAGLGFPSVKNTYAEDWRNAANNKDYTIDRELKTDGAFNLNITARGIFSLTKKTNLIDLARYRSNNYSNKCTIKEDSDADADLEVDGEIARDQKRHRLDAGVALNSKVIKKTLVIAAIPFNYIKTSYEGTEKDNLTGATVEEHTRNESITSIPLNIAFEYEPFKSLAVRMGLSKPIYEKTKTEITDPDWAGGALTDLTTRTDLFDPQTATAVSLGTGVKATDALTLDAVIQQDVIFTGTYIISGIPESLAAQITVTYRF